MGTIEYIINIIKRFGLFGTVDAKGLMDELINYQAAFVANNPEWRAHNIRVLRAVDEVKAIRNRLNSTGDKWVNELIAERTAASEPNVSNTSLGSNPVNEPTCPACAVDQVELPFPVEEPVAGSLGTTISTSHATDIQDATRTTRGADVAIWPTEVDAKLQAAALRRIPKTKAVKKTRKPKKDTK